MTGTELYNHSLQTLRRVPNHTIVRHKKPGGQLCYRIRDEQVNPIENMDDETFQKLNDNDLIIKINEREWQLKP